MFRRLWFALAVSACIVSLPLAARTQPQPAAGPPTPAAAATASPKPVPPYNRLAWRPLGPAISGGRVTAVVGAANDPKLYYVGTAGGGVWKTVDGGATWSPAFDKQDVSSIGAIALDPKNENVVWVGTGETNPRNDVSYGDGLYKSVDGGKTWKNVGLRDTMQISSIAVDPRDSNAVVVGAMGDFFADSTARGIFRTTDGGATWAKTLYVGPRSGVSDLAVDPQHPSVMYAGVWQFRREPWTFTSGGPDDALYKSVDGGATWTRLTGNGLPEGATGRIGLAVAPSNPSRVYALIESKAGILWRSDDAGATWKLISSDTLVDQRPFYFTHVRVDPRNADRVYGISEMLSLSIDGGKTFKEIAKGVHVDYHAMWIAPNDPDRAIVGEDGGYALTLDGKHWSFSRNLAIGQVYHVGYDDQTPYRVCAPLQDNNGFCGPSNGLSPEGIPNAQWERVVGGDGMWAAPDPLDPNFVWTDLQDGRLFLYDRGAKRGLPIQPWVGTSADGFKLYAAPYRFNWNSPIAFAPWDPHVAWYGGNVVFETTDRGRTWRTLSPDLTRNVKAHQQPAGGPLALDVSGAEFSDTLLDIEGSPLRRGEIWTGADDGAIFVTTDGGAHWRDVTPAGVPPDGRVETVAPSPLVAGTAYAVVDRHLSGDRTAYALVTHDFGAHWTSIAAGLPAGQEARAIRADARNPHLVYLGLENSLWLSYDDGKRWSTFDPGLPPVAIYDIRIQPRTNSLLVATHGRSLYAFDDLAPVQELPAARAAGAMLFAPQIAYEFGQHADDEGLYTRFAGKNPPAGASISFYQSRPGPKPPVVDILDAQHRVVRHVVGTTKVHDEEVPLVTNDPGLNRITWDFHEDGPVRWNGAVKDDYKGPRTGARVVPGSYVVRVRLAGRTFEQALTVRPDPRVADAVEDDRAAYAFVKAHELEFSAVDTALNSLDAMLANAKKRMTGGKNAALDARLTALAAHASALRGALTADYHNDEDSLQRPGMLREDLERFLGAESAPTQAFRDAAERTDATYRTTMHDVDAFLQSDPLGQGE